MPVQIAASIIRARKNVFLDFLSPENHVIYGADRNFPISRLERSRSRRTLRVSLSASVFNSRK